MIYWNEGVEEKKMDLEAQISEMQASQDRICALFFSVANHQDWQPELNEWSFRFIAAHMAQVELDCHLNRVQVISTGEKPHYTYYINTGWDFSAYDIQDSISLWRERRNEVVMMLRRLDEDQLQMTGTHDHFGEFRTIDIIKMAIDHDKEHEDHLNEIMVDFKAGKGRYAYPGTAIASKESDDSQLSA